MADIKKEENLKATSVADAEKLDYTIELDGKQYDLTAADSLHADLANQVEQPLVINSSVLNKTTTEQDELKKLKATITKATPYVGDGTGAGTNSFSYKGNNEKEITVVPSTGGVYTGPIFAPDIDTSLDGDSIYNDYSKYQVTNYNSVDVLIQQIKGFPVYKWDGTKLTALTQNSFAEKMPDYIPFKVVLYEQTPLDKTLDLTKINFGHGVDINKDWKCKFLAVNIAYAAENIDVVPGYTPMGGLLKFGEYTYNGNTKKGICKIKDLGTHYAESLIDKSENDKLLTAEEIHTADTTLQSNIETEAATRKNADDKLVTNINTLIKERLNNDTNIWNMLKTLFDDITIEGHGPVVSSSTPQSSNGFNMIDSGEINSATITGVNTRNTITASSDTPIVKKANSLRIYTDTTYSGTYTDAMLGGRVIVSTLSPSGGGKKGDIWIKIEK